MTEKKISAETITTNALINFIANSKKELDELFKNIEPSISEDIGVMQKKAAVARIIQEMKIGKDALFTSNQKINEAIYSENETQLTDELNLLNKLSESMKESQDSFPEAFNALVETISNATKEFKHNEKLKENSGRHWELSKKTEKTIKPMKRPFLGLSDLFSGAVNRLIGSDKGLRLKPLSDKKLFS